MLARQVEHIPARPRTGGWVYEPKWDGFRACLLIDKDQAVNLLSRRGKSLKHAFPELVAAAYELLPARTILDGEIVCWTNGKLDFGALQARNLTRGEAATRLATETPAHLIAFDLLQSEGADLTGQPLIERRRQLEALFAEIPAASPLALGMQTTDEDTAKDWFADLAAVGVEGIVAKPATSKYHPGDRTQWQKIKHYATAEAIVAGITGTLHQPIELLLGRRTSPDGDLRVVGRTVPLHPRAAAAVAAHLAPAGTDHPWPDVLPRTWPGGGKAATEYVKVDPQLVVEIRVDVATQADRWRHGLRFLRVRPDLEPADVPWNLDTN